jgi:hypothetical protein
MAGHLTSDHIKYYMSARHPATDPIISRPCLRVWRDGAIDGAFLYAKAGYTRENSAVRKVSYGELAGDEAHSEHNGGVWRRPGHATER